MKSCNIVSKHCLGGLLVTLLSLLAISAADAQIIIPDSGFESPVIGSSVSYFQYEPTLSPWTFTGTTSTGFAPGAGIAANGSFFTSFNSPAPQGSQVAFIQGAGTISQTLGGFIAGDNYTLTFQAAQRVESDPFPSEALTVPGIDWNVAGQTWNATIDGSIIKSYAPGESATGYTTYTANFTATSSSETLGFIGTNLGGGDNTVFIDNAQIAQAAPEPSTCALMLGGFGLLAVWRKRVSRALL